MTLLSRYTTSNLVNLLDEIYNNSYIERNPYFYHRARTIPLNDNQVRLEIELAGYTRDQIEVYTERNSLYVLAKSEKDSSSRHYHRSWSIAENERINSVKYENGLLMVIIDKVVPEEHLRKNYQIE